MSLYFIGLCEVIRLLLTIFLSSGLSGPKFNRLVLLTLWPLWQRVSCCGISRFSICLPIAAFENISVLASEVVLVQSKQSHGLARSGVVLSIVLLLFVAF